MSGTDIRSTMDQPRWDRMASLFLEALDWVAENRPSFLEQACPDDAALRHEVLAMLEAHDDVRGLEIERCLLVDDGESQSSAAVLSSGTRIGPYRITAIVGQGGMGAVYLAERADEQFHKRVAIKLVKRGMDTDEVLRRFRHERQILASLEHPNIARLYDGGVSEDGRPYFVMEYVEGRPITAYCDEHRLGVESRLALFQIVCQAVQYAHQNLVVHRDIKPSNVLVAEPGEVKLLDFGIAKLLGDNAQGAASQTRTESRVLTPDYASPEQFRGRPVTTASDAYSLGVVLYELLTGRRPFSPAARRGFEVAQPVPEWEAKRPSAVVLRADEHGESGADRDHATPEAIAAARGTTPDRLRRRLRGDLDTITLKALESEPDRRYTSAAALLDDVDRHLKGLPVAARRDTTAYRAAKFVRRHRAGVLAAALVLLSLVGGLGAALWQAERADRAAEQAARERDVAQGVSAFLEGLFKAPDPFAVEAERLDTLRVRDFLARGAAKVQRELRGQPAVEARMLDVLGEVHHNLGSHDQAQPLLEEALRLRQQLHGAEHAEVAETQTKLGVLLRDRGDLAAADSLLRASLATRRQLYGNDHADVGETLNELAALRRTQGQYDEAVRRHEEALASLRNAVGEKDLRVVLTLSELANTLGEKGDLERAERYARDLLALSRSMYGNTHPWVALALGNLSAQLQRKGDYDAAEEHARASLAIAERTLGPEHPWVGEMLNILGVILYRQREFEEAERLLRRSLAMKRKYYGRPHQSVAVGMFNLALLLRAKGDLDAAEALNREALAMDRQVGGDDHPHMALHTGHLAVILQAKGDCRGALPLFREAIARMRRVQSSDDTRIQQTRSEMGACLTALRRYAEAEPVLLESHRALDSARKEVAARAALERLVALYTAWNKPEKAAEYRALLPDSAATAIRPGSR